MRQQGHDVAWIRTESPGISDPEVVSRAQAENRILLTFDIGYGNNTTFLLELEKRQLKYLGGLAKIRIGNCVI
ncbi:MAG TPA: hypothetical protein DCP31_25480 [Cyanobacteria bacterium UBA8543]|nr:hypothetical protein [Cyanobacteria bacterium UBA8543]